MSSEDRTAAGQQGPPSQQQQQPQQHQQQPQAKQEMIVDEDPLLIAQTLTYVTDDGSVVMSFQSAPFSWCKKKHWEFYTLYSMFSTKAHFIFFLVCSHSVQATFYIVGDYLCVALGSSRSDWCARNGCGGIGVESVVGGLVLVQCGPNGGHYGRRGVAVLDRQH